MSKIGSSTKIQRLLKESSLLCHSGKFNQAKEIYQALLKLIPNHPEVLGNLGTIELQGANTDLGISYLTRALKSNPTEIKFIINLANAYISINKFTEALEQLESAEKISPNLLNILYNKARALRGLNEFDAAITYLKKCLTLDPDNYLILCDLALLFTQKENFQEAIDLYSKAISINPKNFLTFYNRGIALESIGQFDEALNDYNQVIKENPLFEPAHFNKCGIFTKQKKIDEALNLINHLLKLDQGNITYYIEKAFIYEQINNFDSAIASYNQALLINPKSEEVMTKKGFCLLRNDQFQEGWSLSETRWGSPEKLQTSKPELLNFNVVNKKILIWAEQGVGDQIIFSGLFQEIFSTKNIFYVSLDPRLINLYIRSFSWAKNVNFISQYDNLDEDLYDYQLPITSVGKFFRNSIQDFKFHPKAYLRSDKAQTEALRNKFKKYPQKICGLSWFSKNNLFGRDKSLSLDQLLPVFFTKNTIFVNLQYGDVSNEIKKISDQHGIEILSISGIDNFNDIDGLASLIDMCDYIVTTSNVTAHIAGALNKTTYLMLPFSRGKLWYWGNSSDRCLWYPSIEIFRASSLGEWDTAINNLSKKLKVYYE